MSLWEQLHHEQLDDQTPVVVYVCEGGGGLVESIGGTPLLVFKIKKSILWITCIDIVTYFPEESSS